MDILSLNKQSQEYSFKPSQNSSSPKELDFSDKNIEELLKNLSENAVQKIAECSYIEAISDLLHCEEILESLTAKGELNDMNEVVVLLNNLAMCYQRIGDVDKSLAYLDGALYNFKFFISKPSLQNEIKMNATVCKLNLQSCAMLSQKGQHKEALKYAKIAQGLVSASLNCSVKAFNQYYAKGKKDRKKLQPLKVKKIGSKSDCLALKAVEVYLTSKKREKLKVVVPEWAKQISIADVMLIQPMSLLNLNERFSLTEELSVDSVIYKVILLSLSHYCIATELNYIKSSNLLIEFNECSVESEYLESIKLLKQFTSNSSKIFNHVNEGYLKNCVKSLLEKSPSHKTRCMTPSPGVPTLLNPRKLTRDTRRKPKISQEP